MKICSRCKDTKSLDNFGKSKNSLDGFSYYCKSCTSLRSRENYAKNPEPAKKSAKRWYEENRERAYKNRKEWKRNNRDKVNAGNRIYVEKNREKYNKLHNDFWKRNRDKSAVADARRRAAKLNATPKWANDFFIKEIYHLAKLRTEMTGIKWHVDHVVPLRSKLVCGLHVENNLQVIPMIENARKGNRYWPDMP